ncbi:MAG TPA: hypothetical protein PLP29_13180 [Candidatus Ozemobacteraceae bacterium]|nr:hypothetical protein [Candidatus Ozemobacteraceae bacterium]
MNGLFDAWIGLNQSGRLLDRKTFDALPDAPALPRSFPDRLRDALLPVVGDAEPSTGEMGDLLDLVLETGCGLKTGWRKGTAIGAADAEKLLDGTRHQPRRLFETPDRVARLAVFTSDDERLGVHRGRRAVTRAVEWLRRRALPIGLLTNGREWRLIFTDTDNLAWAEWSADRWLDGDLIQPVFELLRRILSPQALVPGSSEGVSPLLSAIAKTRAGQARLSKELGERVREAVELLLHARKPVLDPIWDNRRAKPLYAAACHFVMRLVVCLFAESRELLPTDNAVYHQAYGLRGLIEALDRAGPDRRRGRHGAWPRLLALFGLLHRGSLHPQLLVPAYGGDLFRSGDAAGDAVARALHIIEQNLEPPSDEIIYRLICLLSRTTEVVRSGTVRQKVSVPVDFTELTSEYIGILYEGLLDYELHRVETQPIIFLNLGDQPALPLDRLETMDDRRLAQLVEKAKVKKTAALDAGDGDEAAGDDEEPDDEAEDAEPDEPGDGDEPDDDDPPETVGEETLPADDGLADARAAALARARAWAERAALAGKLIAAPRGRRGREDPAWQEAAKKAAESLIADLRLPGELYLVRWGGTRKGAGTFYTRPQLTQPTVRRTLEPLLNDADGRPFPPERLLSLKICDPAMGSGSFLIAALRVLTDAVIRSLHEHGRIRRDGERVCAVCDLLPDADVSQPEERLEAVVRRAVVEHCVYGVDIDPLAVELARVALWVETLDRRLPFTFLDHKLRCGDALLGTWLDRFRDYPLTAWWRQSPDEKWRGVTHEADRWARALKLRRDGIVTDQAELVSGQKKLAFAEVSESDLKAAIDRVRELYRRLRRIPAGRPDERARVWREQIAVDPALARVREVFDTWCALWFWPLDRLELAPGPLELRSPSESARAIVREIAERKRFFHWELEFPDVFTEPGAGFDGIVANPPWEVRKPSSKEFFSDLDPLYRSYGKQEALARQRELFAADPEVERRWLEYKAGFKDAGNFVRNAAAPFGDTEEKEGKPQVMLVPRRPADSKVLHAAWAAQRAKKTGLSDPEHPFRHQGSADLNSYKLFVEQACALLKTGGRLGLVTPSGLYTDKGSGSLRQLLIDRCTWNWLYGFENRDRIFDIHRSFKFAVTIAAKGGSTESIKAAFMRHDLDDWAAARGILDYPAERIRAFSPKSLSILEIRTGRDLEVLTKIYGNSVLLGDQGPDGWGITYTREFDMTNDSKLFIPRDKAEAAGYRPDPYGRWAGPDGDILLPLYEGRMIGQFDFSQKGWMRGRGRSAEWRDIPWENKQIEPQYLMRSFDYQTEIRKKYGCEQKYKSKTIFMGIGSATNKRSMYSAVVGDYPCGNAVPVLRPVHVANGALGLTASLNSFAYDFALRLRLGGLNLNYFVLEETPLVLPNANAILISPVAKLAWCHPCFACDWLDMTANIFGIDYMALRCFMWVDQNSTALR